MCSGQWYVVSLLTTPPTTNPELLPLGNSSGFVYIYQLFRVRRGMAKQLGQL